MAHGESNYQFFCAVLDLYYEKDAKGKISRLLFILAELLQCKKEDALCRLEELLDQIWKIKKFDLII